MTITALPTRAALDLGATLSNVRTPVSNELSAVNVEKIKDWIIALASEVGLSDGSTVGSLREAVDALSGGGGFSYVSVTADATLPSSNAIVDVDTTGLTAPDTLELTLPAASAGRVYIVRKIDGAANETITLKRAASEMIDGLAVDRLLPGSDNLIDATGHSTPNAVWTIYCDGTNWRTYQAAPETRAVWGKSGAPSNTADGVASWDYIPGSTWHGGGTPGHLWIQTGVDAGDAKWRRIDAPGLLFELDTTVTTQVAGTTEAQGESGAGGNAPAGTLTPTANQSALWMSARKLLRFAGNASFQGIQVRRIITGSLPAEGYILDVGIGYLETDPNAYGVIMLGYQQNAGTAFTGLGIYMRDGASNCDVLAVGDDGSGAPHTPTWAATGSGFQATLNDWQKGPVRIVAEIRKVDGQTPTQWAIRVITYSLSGAVLSYTASQVSAPEGGFSTPVDLDGWTPDRIGVGLWNVGGAQACEIQISHLRVYELGSALPT